MKDEEWDEVISINLKGAFYLTRAVARGMMKRREGVILNIASVVGLMGNAGQANYAASKAGMLGLTKSVARELAPRGVRVQRHRPGVHHDGYDRWADGRPEGGSPGVQIPMGALGEPRGRCAVRALSRRPGGAYITGQVLTVDGGMVM
jgi:3-oxoacyl-[acyl-carrier protein] reductase